MHESDYFLGAVGDKKPLMEDGVDPGAVLFGNQFVGESFSDESAVQVQAKLIPLHQNNLPDRHSEQDLVCKGNKRAY